MKVFELIELLQKMPQDIEVEVNDNENCEIGFIHSVDLYDETNENWDSADGDYVAVIIQTNVPVEWNV